MLNRLDDNLVVKVADFGLTKDVYETDYYRLEDKSKALPIRWMSIEAIQFSVFTTRSDVVGVYYCFCYFAVHSSF